MHKIAVTKKLELVRDPVEIDLPAALRAHPALEGALPASLAALEGVHFHKLPRGAALYRYEERAERVFFVVRGVVRLQHQNREGETFECDWLRGASLLGAGEVLGELVTYQETARIEEPIEAFSVPRALVVTLLGRDLGLLQNFARALARRHQRGLDNERNLLESAFVRVAKHLTQLALREAREAAPGLHVVHATQDDIAAATGVNPRTVARAMKALQKEGRLYVRRGEYLVRQPLTLARALEGASAA